MISCTKLANLSTLQNLTTPLQTLSKAWASGRHLELKEQIEEGKVERKEAQNISDHGIQIRDTQKLTYTT